MGKTVYVGNLPYSTTQADIQELFAQHGAVHAVRLIADRDTGRFRGYGFVDMEQAGADGITADDVISQLVKLVAVV